MKTQVPPELPPDGNEPLGMSAFGSVSEHDPEGQPDARSYTKTKDGNAGDSRRTSCQQETCKCHAQSPENQANINTHESDS